MRGATILVIGNPGIHKERLLGINQVSSPGLAAQCFLTTKSSSEKKRLHQNTSIESKHGISSQASSSCYTMHPTLHTVRGGPQQARPPCLASSSRSIRHQAISNKKNAMMQRNSSKKSFRKPCRYRPKLPSAPFVHQIRPWPSDYSSVPAPIPGRSLLSRQVKYYSAGKHTCLSLACYARCRLQPVPK